jgi:cation transport ATPase
MKTPPPIKRKDSISVEYYVQVSDEQLGPYDFEKIKVLLEFKNIDENTLIWKEGMKDWDEIVNLFEFNEIRQPFKSSIINSGNKKTLEKEFKNKTNFDSNRNSIISGTKNLRQVLVVKTFNCILTLFFNITIILTLFDRRWYTYKGSNEFIIRSLAELTIVYLIIILAIEIFYNKKITDKLSKYVFGIIATFFISILTMYFIQESRVFFINRYHYIIWIFCGVTLMIINILQVLRKNPNPLT